MTNIHLIDLMKKLEKEDSDRHKVLELAALDPIAYDQVRVKEAKMLNIRTPTLDEQVKIARGTNTADLVEDDDELTNGIAAWSEQVDGNVLAQTMRETLQRHSVLPTGADVALTLWALGTYIYNSFRIFPKLCLSSPEKRCGKTTIIEILGALVHRALIASNVSASVIFRSIDLWHPSLLIDEGDTFVNDNVALRGVINSGHTRSTAFVLRTDGDNHQPKRFSTWSPMAIAMISSPPDTIRDRSVLITLRRKMPGENITRLPLNINEIHRELRQQCQRWGIDNLEALTLAEPNIPKVGNDRAEDNWWPLLAIADHIGGDWPQLAREAMLQIDGTKATEDESVGAQILADIRSIFTDKNLTQLHSQDLVDQLIEMDDHPWVEWKHGKPMTKTSLARLIKPYGVRSKSVRTHFGVRRGYTITQFQDAFARYLPHSPPQSATTLQASKDVACSVALSDLQPPPKNQSATLQATPDIGCNDVTLQTRDTEKYEGTREEFDV